MPTSTRALPPAIATTIGAAMFGTNIYREDAFLSDNPSARRAGYRWGDYQARRLRYAVLWGHYEGSAYRAINTFSAGLKSNFDLYLYIRPIYNPTYRDVEFWAQHLMGGILDCEAGDGCERPSALPIETENDALRPIIAQIWKASNWQAKKETWTRFGAAMGDAPLMVVDDPYRQTVTLKPIHPETVTWFERDDYGNCRGYYLEEIRPHPDAEWNTLLPIMSVYGERCVKVGQSVEYTTYLDGQPHDWRDYATDGERRVGPTWTESYGFVPLVLAQHRDMGLGWGMAEIHPSLPKIHELDDVASKLDDAIRKTVDPRWFFTGVAPGDSMEPGIDDDDDTDEDGSAERNSVDAFYAKEPGANAIALVAKLDVAATSEHIQTIIATIERDHPELSSDLAGVNASGKARRVAQERVEALVAQRRVGYDDSLARALKMAMSIGAMKGYPGFEGITVDSYANGELDLSIGDRPVFAVDEMDRIEEKDARSKVFKTLTDAGMPLDMAAEEAGYSEETIAALVAAQAKADLAAKAAADALAMSKANPPVNGPPIHPATAAMRGNPMPMPMANDANSTTG